MGVLGPARTAVASRSAGPQRAEKRRAFVDMLHKQQQAAATATRGSRAAAAASDERPPSASELPAELRAPASPPSDESMPTPASYAPAALPLPLTAAPLPAYQGHTHTHSAAGQTTRVRKSSKVCPYCICELCQCGSHRCPPTPLHSGPMSESKSMYAGNFPWHPYGPSESAAVKRGLGKSVPFEAGSTTRSDFQWRGFPDRVPAVHSRRGGAPDPSLPFEGATTHRADFDRKPLAVSTRDLPRPKPSMADGRDFLTESRKAFNKKDARPATAYQPARGGVSELPFESESLAASSYRPWATGAARRALPPASHYYRMGESRDFTTENRGEFTGKPLDRCPAIQVALPPTKPYPGHVPVIQDPVTGAWRRSYHQHNPIPVAPSRPAAPAP